MSIATTRADITFTSSATTCAAWHLRATDDALASDRGRPCVVMAGGFGVTRDTGLLGYAESFAAAGIDAFVFDYRGFGASDGTLRQDVSHRRQRKDYHAAIDAARHLPGVDPERIVLWGASYAGGHVVAVAARDPRISAVISLTPAIDGRATVIQNLRAGGPRQLARTTAHGLRDLLATAIGRAPHHLPLVGEPGTAAIITTPGSETTFRRFAGPTWRNEVRARSALDVGLNRPITSARRITCPILIQVAQHDRTAPPGPARKAARDAGSHAQIREYPIDHLDVYDGPWQQRAATDQIEFLVAAL